MEKCEKSSSAGRLALYVGPMGLEDASKANNILIYNVGGLLLLCCDTYLNSIEDNELISTHVIDFILFCLCKSFAMAHSVIICIH